MVGPHGQGAEHLNIDQPPRGIEQAASEHDVPDDVARVLRDEREPVVRSNRRPQRVDEPGHHLPVIAERAEMQVPHGLLVA